MSPEDFTRLAKAVPVNNVGWFDLLDGSGAFARWLQTLPSANGDYALWLLGQPAVVGSRGERVACLLERALQNLEGSESSQGLHQKVIRVFSVGLETSPAVFQLFLRLLKGGFFDNAKRQIGLLLHDLPAKDPSAATQALAIAFDRDLTLSGRTPGGVPELKLGFREDFILQIARSAPEHVVRSMLPRAIALMQAHEVPDNEGTIRDRVWPYITLGLHSESKSVLLGSLAEAMGLLAKDHPQILDDCTEAFERLPHQNVSYLLLTAWSENGERYRGRIVAYFLEDVRRLGLGYGIWGTGNGTAAIARKALEAASPWISGEDLRRLEDAIAGFYPSVEREEPKHMGYTQLLLLHALGEQKLSSQGRRRVQELRRKFPGSDFSYPAPSRGGHFIGSPIPAQATKKMSDPQWITAMQDYRSTDLSSRFRAGPVEGNAIELSRQLEADTRENKERFAALCLKMPSEIPSVYFDALLRGFVAEHANPDAVNRKGQPNLPMLPVETLAAVFQHIHDLPDHPCGHWLCWAIGKAADQPLPPEAFEIVCYYVEHGADPVETGMGDKDYFGGELVTQGINTTRGAAADALAMLLFADRKRWHELRAGLLLSIRDRSWSVRAVAVEGLTALLNVDRSLAVQLFCEAAADAPELLGSLHVSQFLYHAIFTHYVELRALLLDMLNRPDASARKAAAQAIAVASFRSEVALSDVAQVLNGDETCRATAISIAVGNLRYAEAAERCRNWLLGAFRDGSAMVRETAAQVFHEISEDQLCRESGLIDAFLESAAFAEHAERLLSALEESVHRLPDIVCQIPLKAVELHRQQRSTDTAGSFWWTHQMGNLVLRLYEQTKDHKIRSSCLDALDQMIELDFGSVHLELRKLDRS